MRVCTLHLAITLGIRLFSRVIIKKYASYCIIACVLTWSEWRGSNPRPDGPKPPALPTALHPVMKFPPLETTHASDLTFILYINTAQSAIFFSARLPRQSYYCAEGSDAADAASEPSAEAAPYKSKPSFFSLFRTADVLRLISAAISLIGTALLHMSAARSSCS